MLAKMLTITLMCTITGALGDIYDDMLTDELLSYFDLPSGSTRAGSTSQVQVLDFNSLVNNALISDDKSINTELLNKVSFFAKAIYAQATKDSEKLQLDIEQLKIKLSPYSEEVTKLFTKTTSDLAITLDPYVKELQTQVEKITLEFVQKLKSINLDLNSDPASMKVALVLFSQQLEIKVVECLNSLKSVVGTCTEKVKEKIDLQGVALYQNLSPFVEDMQDNLKKQTENLSFLMKKSVMMIESKILETIAMLEKQLTLCTSLLREKKSLFFGNVRKTLALCLYDMSQKVSVFKVLVTPYREALIKSVVLRFENIKNMLDGSAAVSLADKKNFLEKSILDNISNLLNNTLLTPVIKIFSE